MHVSIRKTIREFDKKLLKHVDHLPSNAYAIVAVVAIFGLVGTALLAGSNASTPVSSSEAEAGTVSAAASKVSDTSASGGQAVKFSSGSAQPSGPGADPSVLTTAGLTNPNGLTTITGDYSMTDGESISNKHITGDLYMAPNTTATNVKVDGELLPGRKPGGNWYSPIATNMKFIHSQAIAIFTIGFDGLTIDASKIGGESDTPDAQTYDYLPDSGGARPANHLTIKNSYFIPPGPATSPDPHIEALHCGACQNLVLTNNVFDYRAPNQDTWDNETAVLNIGMSEITGHFSGPMTMDHNTLYGGSYYMVYLNVLAQSSVTNNAFFDDTGFGQASIQYPISAYTAESTPPGGYQKFSQSGNVLNGQPTTLPGGL